MQVFGGKFSSDESNDKPRSNFDNFWISMLTVFQVSFSGWKNTRSQYSLKGILIYFNVINYTGLLKKILSDNSALLISEKI